MNQEGTAPSGGIRVILCLRFNDGARFDEVTRCKRALLANPDVLHCLEVSGSFHLMAEVAVSDLAAYQAMLDGFTARFGSLLSHYEANFICRRYERQDDSQNHCLWVPCPEGRQRVDCAQIDRIMAEGDYVRVISGDREWLLHATLTSIARQLETEEFVQLSRSVVVRTGFIARLAHQGRRWSATLVDGTDHRIAKARTARVLASLRNVPATELPRSATVSPLFEIPHITAEKAVH